MHHSSQGKIALRSYGGYISEEKIIIQKLDDSRRINAKDEQSKSIITDQASKGIKIYKSMSLYNPTYDKSKRLVSVNPEISKRITETSELTYKQRSYVLYHQPSYQKYKGGGSISLSQDLIKKRNHFLTIVSRLPTKKQERKLKI